ncbi:Domain of unknown function / Efflux ABC transporter, permease protein [hydrothermal vent metagenome]|uniref:ABC transmembrane type-2 domain-containing protein n=1 Tax=hydrothermal vent metagenome TaxID=652676 RepID=A0A3B0Z9K7_9ZZZZ
MFSAALAKEFKLVFRDLHSILVLFVMPAVFIVIMSLAMQEQFSDTSDFKLSLKFHNADQSIVSETFIGFLTESQHIEFTEAITTDVSVSIESSLDNTDKAYFYIPEKLSTHFDIESPPYSPLELHLSPSTDARTRLLILSVIEEALAKTRLTLFAQALEMDKESQNSLMAGSDIKLSYLYQSNENAPPTAVQQSVPAWLIFSMFFVVIPISTTLITEKQQGTLNRLRTMNISMPKFLLAKIFPYLLINQFQLVIMILLGIYLIPLLGGEQLTIGGSLPALAIISLATGFAAVGFALLIAVIAKTTEQATSIGGVGNILLAATGGIMVPKFVMPEYLQPLTNISPMSWGLEGFLDIFLRKGDVSSIINEVGILLAFGLSMLTIALIIGHKQR